MRGTLDFRESPPRISGSAAAHISVLLGFFFVQRAYSYWLSRFGLLYHTNGVVYGMRYVDHVLWQPGLWVLVGAFDRRRGAMLQQCRVAAVSAFR